MSAVPTDVELTLPSARSTASLIEILKREPIIGRATYESLSRLLPHVERIELASGEAVYHSGGVANALFYVLKGEVRLANTDGVETALVERGYVGEESVLGSASFMATAQASTDVVLLRFPREAFNTMLAANPSIKNEYFVSVLNRFTPDKMQALRGKSGSASDEPTWTHAIGWLLCVLLPPLVFFSTANSGLDPAARVFLGVFAATATMWVFRLVADFIPGIFVLLGTVIFGLVPPNVVFSGFASDGFFMALSILGLSAVIVASGLSYRILLWLLKIMPQTTFFSNLGIFMAGMVLSPVVPSINGRVALTTPLLIDMVEALGFKFKGPGATRLAASCFTGVSLLSAVFLTSKSVNFVIFGLLPVYAQEQFQWLAWLLAASVSGGVMILAYFIVTPLFFRGSEQPRLSKDLISAQLALLGPVRAREYASLFGVVAFTLLVVTQPIHKIAPPWVGLLLLFFLLAFNYLRGTEFKDKIDWPFLMYLAGLTGMVAAMSYLGISKYLASHLGWLGVPMKENFPLFLALVTVVLWVMRIFAPINAVVSISATVLMPLAEISGVNPWIVGFVILTMGECWFAPYQCSYYVQFEEITRKKRVYSEKQFLTFNALLNFIKLGSLYASIPLWTSMGLL